MSAKRLVSCAFCVICGACGPAEGTGGGGGGVSHVLLSDKPIDGLTAEQEATFNDGDLLFDQSLHEGDGLGPLYTRNHCAACHDGALRGPGIVQKMSVVLADGVTPDPDQSKLAFGNTVHPLTAGGGLTPIVPPEGDPTIKVTVRVGPPVVGRGYMEAVADSEIQRMEDEQAARVDGIHGRINHVVYASEPNPETSFHTHAKGDVLFGRFGLKGRIATLDDFTADAAQGDMGITSPLRPEEFPNPDALLDDAKPGVDVGIDSINVRADYMRMLEMPRSEPALPGGDVIFEAAKCSVCHAPSLHTRPDYPLAPLADVDAFVYTDFLLHDMGDDLADGLEGADGEATSREWRTPPLIGIGLLKTFLHDGRAKSLEDAIALHRGPGSQANPSIDLFDALSTEDKDSLLAFVSSL